MQKTTMSNINGAVKKICGIGAVVLAGLMPLKSSAYNFAEDSIPPRTIKKNRNKELWDIALTRDTIIRMSYKIKAFSENPAPKMYKNMQESMNSEEYKLMMNYFQIYQRYLRKLEEAGYKIETWE